jgi:nucleotide-binding universal stress UspA family protein
MITGEAEMFKKILVPLDGSTMAEQVYPHVAGLAQAFDSELDLLSVCEPEETAPGQVCRLYLNAETEQLRALMKTTSVRINQKVVEGNPTQQMLKYAVENGVDTIMLTSHGSSGIKPWSLGSTVNKLLHTASVPMIVVRATESADASASSVFSRILVPLDGSEASSTILPVLKRLAGRLPVEITLLQVIEKGHKVHTVGGLNYIPYKDLDLETRSKAVKKYLAGAAAGFAGTLAETKTVIRLGDPAEEILKQAAEMETSMIALASHVHSALEAWFYGSTVHKIVQSANRSFMLVTSGGKKEPNGI